MRDQDDSNEGIVKEFIIPHYERPNDQPLYENEHRNDHTHVEDDDESKEALLSRSLFSGKPITFSLTC